MQVLFLKHVWLFTEYMPTLHWWIGASSVSPYVIAITLGIASGIIIHHWSFPMSFSHIVLCLFTFPLLLLQSLQNPEILLLLLLPLLPYYFATKHFAADTKLSRCGWIDNSIANTQEYSLDPLVSINKFGWNTLRSKAIAIPYTCGLSVHCPMQLFSCC